MILEFRFNNGYEKIFLKGTFHISKVNKVAATKIRKAACMVRPLQQDDGTSKLEPSNRSDWGSLG